MKISECDFIFLSYDEPNADLNYATLCNQIPWAKRVHGVKGSDHAHKAAAELSDTGWLVTVDADNKVFSNFFDIDLDISNKDIQVYSWLAQNKINGLLYGNGGLKVWKKDFILSMKTHESAEEERAQVDFCWENGYKQMTQCFSETDVTGSPFQAWRAGFREGVKMTLLDGVRVPPQEIKERIWWHNIHRLRMWATVGMHVNNGKYSILGTRMGAWMANCTDWNYIDVRDFDKLKSIFEQQVSHDTVEQDIHNLGVKIRQELGFNWPFLDEAQSEYTFELYKETVKMSNSYYR
jgi:hypothetical protein